jgi:pantothenate kinase
MVFTVPAELVSRFKGASLDIGGSLIKFVYRDIEDKDFNTNNAERGRLRLVSFPKCNLTEALDYVRQRVDISRNSDDNGDGPASPTVIYATGFGVPEMAPAISEALNVQIDFHIDEGEFNTRSFVYLARHLSRQELLEPFPVEATAEPLDHVNYVMQIFRGMPEGIRSHVPSSGRTFNDALRRVMDRSAAVASLATGGNRIPLVEAEPDVFPCLTVACGSAVMYTLVDKDGRYTLVDGLNNGGSAFLGLGNIAVGAKTFTELIQLASKGDHRNVDFFYSFRAMASGESLSKQENDMYHKLESTTSSYPLYCFGRAVGVNRDELKREDVARAVLNYVVRDIVKSAQFLCQIHGVGRVFFYGGLCNHPFVRSAITAEFIYRMLFHRLAVEIDRYIEFDFIRPGTYLGALGCAVNDVEKFITK